MAALLVLLLLPLGLVGACRPAIADEDTGGVTAAPAGPGQSLAGNPSDLPGETEAPSTGPATPEPSLEAIATAVPAQALQPATQVNVQVRLFHGYAATDTALLYAEALGHYPKVNLVVDIAPPISGYDIFAVDPAPDVVPVWIGTLADASAAAGKGVKLEAVGELTGRDPTVLVTPKKTAAKGVAGLKGKVLVDGPEAAASLRAAGLPSSASTFAADDPAAPFDPTPLFDGTATAAVVSAYEGWARIQEGAVNAGLDPAAYVASALHPADASVLGELIWVQPGDLADVDRRAAVTAFLGVVAQAQVECRDNLDDCAGTAGAQSDRTPDGIAWSIDQLDQALFPSKDGILHMDPAEWQRTVAFLTTAKVSGVETLSYSNELVDTVLKALASLDIHGIGWKPENRPLFP
jgi:hypothetical protein